MARSYILSKGMEARPGQDVDLVFVPPSGATFYPRGLAFSHRTTEGFMLLDVTWKGSSLLKGKLVNPDVGLPAKMFHDAESSEIIFDGEEVCRVGVRLEGLIVRMAAPSCRLEDAPLPCVEAVVMGWAEFDDTEEA